MNDAAGDMIIFLFDDLPLLILDHLTIKVGPESKSIAYDSHPQAPMDTHTECVSGEMWPSDQKDGFVIFLFGKINRHRPLFVVKSGLIDLSNWLFFEIQERTRLKWRLLFMTI